MVLPSKVSEYFDALTCLIDIFIIITVLYHAGGAVGLLVENGAGEFP